MKLLNGATLRTLQFGSIVVATSALVACGGGTSSGSSPSATVSGTAAVGAALANASITLTCKNGSGSATANSNGAYSATFAFDGPCAITATERRDHDSLVCGRRGYVQRDAADGIAC